MWMILFARDIFPLFVRTSDFTVQVAHEIRALPYESGWSSLEGNERASEAYGIAYSYSLGAVDTIYSIMRQIPTEQKLVQPFYDST